MTFSIAPTCTPAAPGYRIGGSVQETFVQTFDHLAVPATVGASAAKTSATESTTAVEPTASETATVESAGERVAAKRALRARVPSAVPTRPGSGRCGETLGDIRGRTVGWTNSGATGTQGATGIRTAGQSVASWARNRVNAPRSTSRASRRGNGDAAARDGCPR